MAKANLGTLAMLPSLPKHSELAPALLLLGGLFVLLVPLPIMVLDMLLAFNLGLTILVLLITLNATRPLDFSVFPGLLLLLTLFRLALNVATTRQILVNGEAGFIVATFGEFVVAGSMIVGFVIFIILIIVQFVVITKGAGRISEVAARFVLDALPGKQMAIDAEFGAGLIGDQEAKSRRDHLMRETEFYGAMDGASKFVRGDAIAGIIITAVNLLGGIAIGLSHGLPMAQTFATYTKLSIGDGLVSQIPALIVATASGILVTKATAQANLGEEIGSQFKAQPRPLLAGAAIMLGLALIPGLPKLPFIGLALVLWFVGRRLLAETEPGAAAEKEAGEQAAADKAHAEMPADEFLQADLAAVEIGARLIPLVEPKRGVSLLDHIASLRRDLGKKDGLWVPPIRIRDNLDLDSDAYRLLIAGQEIGRGELRPGRWLAIDPGGGSRIPLEGEATTDPSFGLPAMWVEENDRRRAELAGHTVVDAPTVLITHLGEIVKRHAHELLSREDLKQLIDRVRESAPTVVDELIPNILTVGAIHQIICLLLEERVPISHLTNILESLARHAPQTKDPLALSEFCRVDLGRAICERFRGENGRLFVLALDPLLELEFRRALQEGAIAIEPNRLEKLVTRLLNEWHKATAQGRAVALLTDAPLRRPLRKTLVRSLPDLPIVAYQEVPGDLQLEPLGIIKSDDLNAEASIEQTVESAN